MEKKQLKIYSPQILNLGDFFNCMPVLSGIFRATNDPIRLVTSPSFRQFNGFREFMEFQPCIGELVYRDEIINMDEQSYIVMTYSAEEFRYLTERPYRPIETMRCEKFISDNYPHVRFKVDDDFKFLARGDYARNIYLVGDRWASVTDTRRDWNILKDSGLFDDETKFQFLDYTQPLLDNAGLILSSDKPFIGTFTGSGMLADLLGVENWCLWDEKSMTNWNGAPIEYSYWKHYYQNRSNRLIALSDPFLRTL